MHLLFTLFKSKLWNGTSHLNDIWISHLSISFNDLLSILKKHFVDFSFPALCFLFTSYLFLSRSGPTVLFFLFHPLMFPVY